MKHPVQPLVRDETGTIRFTTNKIVRWLIESGKLDLSKIAVMPFDAEDRAQISQLSGYSVGGYMDLSYVTEDMADAVDAAEQAFLATEAASASASALPTTATTPAEPTFATVFLTDDRPVKIRLAEWPVVCAQFDLVVRRHRDNPSDGRWLVYVQGKSGALLEAPDAEWLDVVAAVRQVGRDAGLSAAMIRACVASLPAEVL